MLRLFVYIFVHLYWLTVDWNPTSWQTCAHVRGRSHWTSNNWKWNSSNQIEYKLLCGLWQQTQRKLIWEVDWVPSSQLFLSKESIRCRFSKVPDQFDSINWVVGRHFAVRWSCVYLSSCFNYLAYRELSVGKPIHWTNSAMGKWGFAGIAHRWPALVICFSAQKSASTTRLAGCGDPVETDVGGLGKQWNARCIRYRQIHGSRPRATTDVLCLIRLVDFRLMSFDTGDNKVVILELGLDFVLWRHLYIHLIYI